MPAMLIISAFFLIAKSFYYAHYYVTLAKDNLLCQHYVQCFCIAIYYYYARNYASIMCPGLDLRVQCLEVKNIYPIATSAAAKKEFLIQLSFGAAERVFSLLNS